MKYAITHPGPAHRDEFLALCLLLAKLGDFPIYRRNPTIEELNDPEVFVIDIGMKYEVENRNFDHHQLDTSIVEASLSLIVKFLDMDMSDFPWYNFSIIMDQQGPRAAAKFLNLEKIPADLNSPIEKAILDIFATFIETDEPTRKIMSLIGLDILSHAESLKMARRIVNSNYTIIGDGVYIKEGILSTPAINSIIRQIAYENFCCFSVTDVKDRDDEIITALFRFPLGEKKYDFYKTNAFAKFAHKAGFLANLKSRNEIEKALEVSRI